MKKAFVNDALYHILNRGVEKRKIFLNKSDRIRFIHNLYEFNDSNPALNPYSNRTHNRRKIFSRNRNLLVEVQCFSLMPNHHHLICRQLKDGGISLFIKKLHGGYARAFNEKHKRVGHLFQGKFKAILVDDDRYLMHLVCYIHANPLDLWQAGWRKKSLDGEKLNEALEFLKKYRWSSHLDFIGKKNFPSVTNNNFVLEIFGGRDKYLQFFTEWLRFYEKNVQGMSEYALE